MNRISSILRIPTLTVVLLSMFCSSCSEAPNYEDTPAKKQISEYSLELKKCEAEKAELLKQQSVSKTESIENVSHTQSNKKSTNREDDLSETKAGVETKDAKVDQSDSVNNNQDIVKNSEKPLVKQTKRSLTSVSDDDIVIGNQREGKILFIEYFSPTCSHCAYYKREVLPKIKEKYVDTGKIVYVMRECVSNKQDLDASILARCKGDFNSYMQFIHVLLSQQSSWAIHRNYRDMLNNLAQLGGVSLELYQKCLGDENLTQLLIENTRLVTSTPRFVGTPAFFINGVQFLEGYTFEALSKIIDQKLKENQVPDEI